MKFRLKFDLSLRGIGMAGVLVGAAGFCSAADEAAHIRSFNAPTGENYYSISLTAGADAQPAVPHDHILLVDTSASQVGDYRQQTLAVAAGLLRSLPETDRVSVVAVDLASTGMTDGLVSPAAAIETGLAGLQRRFPAGATNLLSALQTAKAQLTGDRPGTIIFLGDGMSTAHLLNSEELTGLLSDLRNHRIPVHSLAIGPNKDVRLLGILAAQTGGALLVDDWRNDDAEPAQELGRELAVAANQPVWYPVAMETDADVLPTQALPIRGDRSTVLVGRGHVEGKTISLTSAAGEQKTWTLGRPESEHGNTFLYGLWSAAEQHPAIGAGVVGEDSLALAQTAFEDQVTALENAGYQALQDKDLSKAEEIGFAIRGVDPENVRAVGLINAAATQAEQVALLDDAAAVPSDDAAAVAGDEAPVASDAASPTVGAAPANAASPLDSRTAPATDQGLIEIARQRQEALAQKLQGELDQTKAAANRVLRADPSQALDMLERMRNTLKTATDVSPEARERMLRELNSFTQYVRNEAAQRDQELQALQLRDRINESQAQLIEKTRLDDQRMEQLVDRVRALLIDFREGNDYAAEEAEMVSRLIVDLRPGNPLGMAALTVSEAAGQLRKAHRMRALRADKFLATLYEVERSHVPFPDEPPVLYPPAEVWQALTERRRKWNSVDLKQNNPNEQRIYDALEKKVDLDLIDSELSQVIQFLSDRYQIPIIADEARMTEFGVGLDEQITMVISGVSLKSALKLILEQKDLTYIIEDEVMKITTTEYANQLLQTRVYPVADLVIPIQPLFMGQGGGNFGQQSGGQNQNQFGGGGGGGGGIGLNIGVGGGGGVFSVPAEDAPRGAFDNSTIDRLQKKP
ncbi:MAG: VWA domain-containing protein [Planctomycetaceae bacterium]|nr:VWA domain-containing protein [Planctomycetaceae bacterium]